MAVPAGSGGGMRGRPVAALFGLRGGGGSGGIPPEQRATDELRAAATLMSEAQRVANFGSWEWKPGEDRVSWSDHLYRILGLDPAAFTASIEGFLHQVHPDDRDAVRSRIEAAVAQKRPFQFEHRIVRPGGETRTLRSVAEPILAGESGEVDRVVGVCQDVSELAQTEVARADADARFRNAFENAPIGIALVDFSAGPDGRMTEVNRTLTELTARSEHELVGSGISALALSEDADVDLALRERLVAGEIDRYAIEKRALFADSLGWLQLSVSTLPAAGTDRLLGIVQVQDVTERKKFEDQLRYIADHDSLTGLTNRRRFREELESRIALQRRYGGEGALLLVDVDRLKEINDTRGHGAGDLVLRKVAEVMRSRMRSTDVIARLAGDEFAALLPNAGASQAGLLAEELVARLAGEAVEGHGIGVSIGVVSFGGGDAADSLTVEQLTASADAAMYRAKQRGGAVVEVAGAVEPVLAARRAPVSVVGEARPGLAERVRHALEHDELILYCQPAIDLHSGDVAHGELFVRLREDAGTSRFLAAAAQEPGLCAEIDRWVLDRALAELRGASSPSRLHVNLSGETIHDRRALGRLLAALAASDHPASLGLEISEATIQRDVARATEALRELAATGCLLILDGFTGRFGSFEYIQRLPLDQVKIDGALTRTLLAEGPDHATIRAVVRLAQGTGKTTVAKLVESPELVPVLRTHGIDIAQGFALAEPAPLPA